MLHRTFRREAQQRQRDAGTHRAFGCFDEARGLRVEVSGACGDSEFRWDAPVEGSGCAASFEVENARLWWTWDMGSPDLYDLTVSLFDGDALLDRRDPGEGFAPHVDRQREHLGGHGAAASPPAVSPAA